MQGNFQMSQAEKFLFKTSFDESSMAREEEKARQAVAPTYDAAELAEAREAAMAEGKQAGLAEGLASAEQAQADALSKVERCLGELQASAAEVEARREKHAIEVGVTIVRKLFPRLAAKGGLDEIEALLEDCLSHLDDEPRIVVRVNDDQLDALRERLDPIAQRCGFEGRMVLLSEPDLGLGDARVEWADGGTEHEAEVLWSKIDALLTQNGLSASEETASSPAIEAAEPESTEPEPAEPEVLAEPEVSAEPADETPAAAPCGASKQESPDE